MKITRMQSWGTSTSEMDCSRVCLSVKVHEVNQRRKSQQESGGAQFSHRLVILRGCDFIDFHVKSSSF